ncbi:unnamed protein product [Paramecium octaurelia]|uniref:Uncharacterized protein n=1 Tax=Paramecium octaurelia TaxID=43137 RepID=A0A8S1WUK9_PAROT|nr:unnamed protein product [Paramecium octaurelia]
MIHMIKNFDSENCFIMNQSISSYMENLIQMMRQKITQYKPEQQSCPFH